MNMKNVNPVAWIKSQENLLKMLSIIMDTYTY